MVYPQKVTFKVKLTTIKARVAYLGSFYSFTVLVVRVVPENACCLSTFSLPLERPNFKNSCSCLFCFEHAKLVFILKFTTGPYRISRGIPFKSVELTCARCGNLCNIICKYKFEDRRLVFPFQSGQVVIFHKYLNG